MASEHERGGVVEHFAGLVDPRAERAKRHELLDSIVITICGVICGADNWVEIEEFGNARLEWSPAMSRFLTAAPRAFHPTISLWAKGVPLRTGWTPNE